MANRNRFTHQQTRERRWGRPQGYNTLVGGFLGFTLIELLLVLVILTIIAGLVIPRFANRAEEARIAAAKADLSGNLPTALDLYQLDAGRLPTTEQGLAALVARPASPPNPRKWSGPYVQGTIPTDPWGNPYQYRHPSPSGERDYDLFSFGPDGVEGGEDDIWAFDR